MEKSSNAVPMNDLRQAAGFVLKQLEGSEEPLFITEEGRPVAVMPSFEAFARFEHEKELLRLVAQGEREIAAGQTYDLDDVLADTSLKPEMAVLFEVIGDTIDIEVIAVGD